MRRFESAASSSDSCGDALLVAASVSEWISHIDPYRMALIEIDIEPALSHF
ncbi:MAG: hypothetical protein ACJASX_004533 [Limisphaerales bacterium]|jgi:hypothetical protein